MNYKKSIRFYSIKLIKITKVKLKFLIKRIISFVFKMIKLTTCLKLIKKYTPDAIKIRCRTEISKYPYIYNFYKKIILWLKKDEEAKENYLIYFFKVYIKVFFFPQLILIIKNKERRNILDLEIKKNLNMNISIHVHSENYKKEDVDTYKFKKDLFVLKDELELSVDTHEVYQKMRFAFTKYDSNY